MRRLRFLAAAASLLATAGCASWRAERARQGRLVSELDALRYDRPIDDVWSEVRRLLAERGYRLEGADAKAVGQTEAGFATRMLSPARETRALEYGMLPGLGVGSASYKGGQYLETDWGRSKDGSVDRYRAEAIDLDGRVRVIFTRFVREGSEAVGTPSRDPALELELARRLDPAAAERIDAAIGQAAR